jgi:hypothetical protein
MSSGDHLKGVEAPARNRRVSKRWTLAAAAAAALVVGATGLASSLAPPQQQARELGAAFFNKNMARAEVVMVKGGTVHDYRLDQGRVLSIKGTNIELLERDGTRQVIPVSPTAQVTINGRFATLLTIPNRANAITIRDGEQPATIVRVTGSPRKP